MTETTRRLEIAMEMLTWFGEIPHLIKRIGEAHDMPSLSDSEKGALREMADRITESFKAAGELAVAEESNKQFYERLIVCTDELRKEIVHANVTLDRLKVPD